MGFPLLYFVFFTLYLSIILTYTTGSAADPQASTCSASAANWRFPLVHDDRLTCLYTRDEELEFQREAASNAVIRSLEDKVVRLQQIVDDLQQQLSSREKQQQPAAAAPAAAAPAAAPAAALQFIQTPVGDAQDILFAVRQIEFASHPYFIELISLTRRRNEALSLALSPVLAVVCSRAGDLEVRSLFDSSLFLRLKLPHAAPVQTLSVFPQGDAVGCAAHAAFAVLTTDEAGIARIHILSVRRPDEETPQTLSGETAEEVSKETRGPLHLTLTASSSFRVSPGGSKKHNCILAATIRGERIILVGGSDGVLSVFSRSGALKSQLQLTEEEGGIQHLAHQGGYTVFASKSCVGHINPTASSPMGRVSCIGMSSPIVSVALDSRRPGRGAVGLYDGQLLYVDLKTWALLHKFPRVLKGPVRVLFAKEKLVAVSLPTNHSAATAAAAAEVPAASAAANASAQRGMAVFNVAAVDRRDAVGGAEAYLLPLNEEITSFAMLRRTGDTTLLALGLSDSALITFFELLHKEQQTLSEESWAHLRLPIMLVTIVVAVGAQVYRSRKKDKRKTPTSSDAASGGEVDEVWAERLQAERRALLLLKQQQQQQQQGSFGDPAMCTDTEEEMSSRENSASF